MFARRSCLYLHVRDILQTKWGETKRRYFSGPQIGDFIKDKYFETVFQGNEKAAWDSFKFVCKRIFGKKKGSQL